MYGTALCHELQEWWVWAGSGAPVPGFSDPAILTKPPPQYRPWAGHRAWTSCSRTTLTAQVLPKPGGTAGMRVLNDAQRDKDLPAWHRFSCRAQAILTSIPLDFYTSFLRPYHITQETYFPSLLLPANPDGCSHNTPLSSETTRTDKRCLVSTGHQSESARVTAEQYQERSH